MASTSATRGLPALTFALVLSQFFRTCLGVMAPELQHDLGLTPAGFGTLSSCFFLSFGLAQIPVGIAFDRYGVGRPARWLLAVGVVSAALFVVAPGGLTAMLAQIGLGLACAPVFMGLMHYAAQRLSGPCFTSFVSRANAMGMVGGLCATAPLGWAVDTFGWRPAIACSALIMLLVTVWVWRTVEDRADCPPQGESLGGMLRASLGLLAVPAMWTLIPMCLAMAAGTSFRNAWGGPYLASVFDLDAGSRGVALAALSLGALVAAATQPWILHRYSLRSSILGWTLMTLLTALVLVAWPDGAVLANVGLLAALATVGVLHPMVMAHGRLLLAPQIRGRGLGVLNSFVFLGSALTSWVFGLIADAGKAAGTPAPVTYAWIFATAALLLVLGLAAYAFSPAVPSMDAGRR
ncbi:MFS transporter [Pseudomonas sp. S31]|uniref:MFS transporter n=1 Tax=Pseudomonas sp. S31 TaxID=1564473 RepID=UPI001912012D|nr:MFS transporter [Pseudomonas sp. S31]MBK5002614.1 MFS transporter [Pseudomonas sp. S31]